MGLSHIAEIAARDSREGRDARYRLYVIEVVGHPEVDFYVGMTGNTVQRRFEQHRDRVPQRAARLFLSGKGRAERLRPDLYEGLPAFWTKEAAMRAEGVLADVVAAQLRAQVTCDAQRPRIAKRQAAKRRPSAAPAKKTSPVQTHAMPKSGRAT
jgi:predicted GIY-YIG superfamily endonuclease